MKGTIGKMELCGEDSVFVLLFMCAEAQKNFFVRGPVGQRFSLVLNAAPLELRTFCTEMDAGDYWLTYPLAISDSTYRGNMQ